VCGIAGVIKFGKLPIQKYQITMMANGLQYRGNDATGVAIMYDDGSMDWLKDNVPAWKFTALDVYNDWCRKALEDRTDARIALVHTRKATKGTPYKSENNHPLVGDEKGAMIIHNGMISNDDSLFASKQWRRYAETDSDIIRAILDDHGGIDKDVIEAMGQLQGFAAVAAVHPATPNKLLLLRDSNPLMVGGTDDYFAFASDKRVITQVCTPWVRRFGIPMRVHAPDIAFVPMVNESGWIIDTQKGLEYHSKFQCNGFTGRGNTRYVGTDTSYLERQQRFAKEAEERKPEVRALVSVETHVNPTRNYGPPNHNHGHSAQLPDYVVCPNYTCSKHVRLTEVQRALELNRLSCRECSTSLANALHAGVN
jgi:asparagine synthetase B (glutamine-hydrolysing)